MLFRSDGEALITATTPDGHSACCNVYCGTQVAIQEQIEADEVKIALGVLGGFAVLAGVLALATSGGSGGTGTKTKAGTHPGKPERRACFAFTIALLRKIKWQSSNIIT